MKRGGLGLLALLIVALIVAWLVLGQMRDRAAPAETGTPQSDPVQQARQVVDLYNQHAQQAEGQ